MKLTRLRLLGFKSFVEPTDFLIEPGLTGVVGPNGCGKSNLVEALRWVMGESSHKAMRAADMDDVIFSGTNNRPGRNNAEVAMHIDNSARKAPAQFNEHESLDVSRRIERDQGSTYRINGREVRARDVHILFADASTGSRSPALVHQGRIGEIIQAKPEQRRRVLAEAEHAHDLAVRVVAERTGEQAAASTRQALAAAGLPALREAEAKAAAALQRLVIARETLDQEEARARDRMAELELRLTQLNADIERERRLAADAEAALAKLTAEADTLEREATANAEQRTGVNTRVVAADTSLAEAEKTFGELTGRLADLTARRNQLDDAIRTHGDRLARLEAETAAIDTELAQLDAANKAGPDLAALATAVAQAQTAIAEAEAEALRAEAAHSAARQALDVARPPLAEAERRAQRLETEARTLAKLLHVDTKNLWPAVIDDLAVEKGFEAALGAALGDDLEAPVDPSAPMRWAGAEIDPADPVLPEGVERLGAHVTAPSQLARRLAQIGIIERADAPRLVPLLKPGQRLVSRDGDLWRWDGFSVAANAPTGAARRLAGKNRLADIEAEFETGRREVENKQAGGTAAETETPSAATAENDP